MNKLTPTVKTGRNYTLDLIRVIAICLVVMIHASALVLSAPDQSATGFLIANIFDAISRAGVPMFLMISGALLLDETRTVSLKDMLRKALSTAGLLVAWSILYSAAFQVVAPALLGKPVSLFDFVKHAVAGHFHMWYLYMLIGIYLVTPFLRCFVKKENAKLVLLYIALSMVFTFVRPLINILVGVNDIFQYANTILDKFELDFFSCFITYYLTGWYIVHIGIEKKSAKKFLYLLGGLFLALIIAGTQITRDYENMYSNNNILVFLYATSLFLLLSHIPADTLQKNPKPLLALSQLSFGVYIIHVAINTVVGMVLGGWHPLAQITLQFAIVLVSSFFFSYLLSKIPLLKKLVRA